MQLHVKHASFHHQMGNGCMACRYQKQLCEYLEANKAFVAPDKRLNEVLGWINSEVLTHLLNQALALVAHVCLAQARY